MPIGAMPRTTSRGWAGVAAITAGTFVMVTSEFLPIGLLGSIAGDLGVSEGRAGLMVTVPGIVAAVTAPALTMAAGRLDRRTILVGLTALILAADLVVATASSLEMVLVGRMLLGGALGGFWALSAAAGRRLVAGADGDRATALILGGISVGTIVGVPLGTTLADALGWRSAFLSVGGLAVAVLAAQLLVLPSLPSLAPAGGRHLVSVLRNRVVATGYIAAALLASGHFAAYTYLQPFASGRADLDGTALTVLLAAFGIAGVAGTWIGGVLASRNVRHTFAGVALVLSCAIGLSLAAEASFWLVGLGVVLWGAAFGAFPVCVQLWLHKAAPTEFESGSALMVTVFQAAVAAGAFAGGLAIDAYDVRIAFVLGAAVALLALPVLLLSPRPSAVAEPGPAVT